MVVHKKKRTYLVLRSIFYGMFFFFFLFFRKIFAPQLTAGFELQNHQRSYFEVYYFLLINMAV